MSTDVLGFRYVSFSLPIFGLLLMNTWVNICATFHISLLECAILHCCYVTQVFVCVCLSGESVFVILSAATEMCDATVQGKSSF